MDNQTFTITVKKADSDPKSTIWAIIILAACVWAALKAC